MGELIRIGAEEGAQGISAVVDSAGAWVVDLTLDGRPVLYKKQKVEDSDGKSYIRGGMHLCSDFFGPVKEPQHGPARHAEWTRVGSLVSGMGATPNRIDMGVALEWMPEASSEIANLRHRVEILTFGRDTLSATLRLRNFSQSPRVVAPGWHPYFFIDQLTTEEQIRSIYAPITPGKPVEITEYDSEADVRGEVSRSFRNRFVLGQNVLTVTSNMPTSVRWTDGLGPYVCYEPTVCGARLDPAEGARILRPGDEEEFSISIKVAGQETRAPKASR